MSPHTFSAIGFLSDRVQEQATDAMFVITAVAATLALYATLRSQFPGAARVMAWPFRMVWVVVAFAFSVPRWVWRQLWRQPDGVSRGPILRISKRVVTWQTSIIRGVVGPMIDGAREASREQHDEQNVKIDEQTATMNEGFAMVNERLDHGSSVMAKHTEAIEEFRQHIDEDAEGHVLRPRPKGN